MTNAFSNLSSDSKFWLLIWSLFLTATIVFSTIIAVTVMHNNDAEKKIISELIAKGQNPMIAKCFSEDLTSKGSLAIICASVTGAKPVEQAASN